MDVLSSRVLLHPSDLERSRSFYRDALGLAVYREFETPDGIATVFFLGGGLLEVSGHSSGTVGPGIQLWMQVRDIEATHHELASRDVTVVRPPQHEPWGLIEMWVVDPDNIRICVVEIPERHPLRWRGR